MTRGKVVNLLERGKKNNIKNEAKVRLEWFLGKHESLSRQSMRKMRNINQ